MSSQREDIPQNRGRGRPESRNRGQASSGNGNQTSRNVDNRSARNVRNNQGTSNKDGSCSSRNSQDDGLRPDPNPDPNIVVKPGQPYPAAMQKAPVDEEKKV